ncbi:hypothetical protein CASFOL_026521 [Castilleja foliolosa]|uniref:1,3-beta-glucan synthase component FKS1-like domain-containing protein n=1 Tax=Castilleja foliolosa TaxID=1961234 RepID=A0ABD3CJ76_9LAMI
MAFELYGMLAGNVSPMTGENVKPAYGGEEEAFLKKVVTPIYEVIAQEAARSKKAISKHSQWRNYDDLNEYFCILNGGGSVWIRRETNLQGFSIRGQTDFPDIVNTMSNLFLRLPFSWSNGDGSRLHRTVVISCSWVRSSSGSTSVRETGISVWPIGIARYLATHPSGEKRAEVLSQAKVMEEALSIYRETQLGCLNMCALISQHLSAQPAVEYIENSHTEFTPQEISALQRGGNASAREIYLKGFGPSA